MDRRGSGRKVVNLRAERISGGKKCDVYIEDISESGIRLITAPSAAYKKYVQGDQIEVRFLLSDGEGITLSCKIVWSLHRLPPEREIYDIGLKIISPPPRYLEFIGSLTSDIG